MITAFTASQLGLVNIALFNGENLAGLWSTGAIGQTAA